MVSKLDKFRKFREILIFSTASGEVDTDFVSHCNPKRWRSKHPSESIFFLWNFTGIIFKVQYKLHREYICFYLFFSSNKSVPVRSPTKQNFQVRDPRIPVLAVRIEAELGEDKNDILGGVCIEEDPSDIPEVKC